VIRFWISRCSVSRRTNSLSISSSRMILVTASYLAGFSAGFLVGYYLAQRLACRGH
jgi:hypothetical protein